MLERVLIYIVSRDFEAFRTISPAHDLIVTADSLSELKEKLKIRMLAEGISSAILRYMHDGEIQNASDMPELFLAEI